MDKKKGKWSSRRITAIVILLIICALGFYGYVFYQDAHKQPHANQVVKMDSQYVLTDTRYYCNKELTHEDRCFSVVKDDSAAVLKTDDICHYCGKKFEKHHTGLMWGVIGISMLERE